MRILVVGHNSLSTSLLHGIAHIFARASILSLPNEKTRNPQELLVLARENNADIVVVEDFAVPNCAKAEIPELSQMLLSLECRTPVLILEDDDRGYNGKHNRHREKQNSARIRTMLKQQKTKIPRR